MFKFIAGIFAGFGIVTVAALRLLWGIPAIKKELKKLYEELKEGEGGEAHLKFYPDGHSDACFCRTNDNHLAVMRRGYEDLPQGDPRRS